MLLGRERECARLDALISRIRSGCGAALIMEGEAGIGKTSLLGYLVSQAAGIRILRARGAECERDLRFAGLADLLRPILGYLDVLPDSQRAALASALAVGPVVRADLFAICAATLGVLVAAAARQPVLAVIDDAHWLDAASARAVDFAARRLGADAIGVVVAVRAASSDVFSAAQFDLMTVSGLDEASAGELLARSGRAIAPAVARRIIDGVGGNPLALRDVPGTLTEAHLSGLVPLPEPLPVGSALHRAFAERLTAINPATRRLLLLAAAAAVDLPTLRRASTLVSADIAGLPAAEDAGLIRVRQGRVEFTHPLLRSACYYGAVSDERRAAHRALAEVSDPEREPVRRAWHLAAAVPDADEGAADSLDQAARVAVGRNAFATASLAYQRAAELTADQDRRVSRWIAAGGAAHLSGDPESAVRLLRRALELAADPCARADAHALLARAAVCSAPRMDLYHELLAAADAVLGLDPERAAILLASASDVCRVIGKLGFAAEAAAKAVHVAAGTSGVGWLLSQVSLAQVTILTGYRETGRRIIRGVLDHPGAKGCDPAVDLVKVRCGQALIWCEEHRLAEKVLRSTVDSARTSGRSADLRYGLVGLSDLHFRTDEWTQAYSEATEAVELTTYSGMGIDLGWALIGVARIEAATGSEGSSREHLTRAVMLAKPAGVASVQAMGAAVSGFLELSLANYARALTDLTRAAALVAAQGITEPSVIRWRPDFVETLVRLGRLAEAREQLAVLEGEASCTGSPWAAAAAARCRGLLQQTPRQAIAQLEDAVARAEASAGTFEQARARLCLGQALRRGGRQAAARRQLEHAQAMFEMLGAGPWAVRAAAYLVAYGVPTAPRQQPLHARLTPQELRVALLVAEGLTNQEVAARLFVSHKTIEVHLGHIYGKLGARSRTGLARLVHTGEIG